MYEMTQPCRDRIRNSIPGGPRPSTLPLGHEAPHNIEYLGFLSLKLEYQSGVRTAIFDFQ